MTVDLDTLFPPAPRRTPTRTGMGPLQRGEWHGAVGKQTRSAGLPGRWASIYALELRGFNNKQIAEALNYTPATISSIVNDSRYIEYREAHITALDAEIISMKPLAYAALRSGLVSTDENTALRASEQFFKATSFGGFSKDPPVNRSVTAEDVAAQLLAQVNVNVNVNVRSDADAGAEGPPSRVVTSPRQE